MLHISLVKLCINWPSDRFPTYFVNFCKQGLFFTMDLMYEISVIEKNTSGVLIYFLKTLCSVSSKYNRQVSGQLARLMPSSQPIYYSKHLYKICLCCIYLCITMYYHISIWYWLLFQYCSLYVQYRSFFIYFCLIRYRTLSFYIALWDTLSLRRNFHCQRLPLLCLWQ